MSKSEQRRLVHQDKAQDRKRKVLEELYEKGHLDGWKLFYATMDGEGESYDEIINQALTELDKCYKEVIDELKVNWCPVCHGYIPTMPLCKKFKDAE